MTIRNFPSVVISTFFFIGYLPFVPGTFGSIAGLFLFYLIKNNILLQLGVTVLVIVLGFLTSGAAERFYAKKDVRFIVIDEVGGMLLSLLFLPQDLRFVIAAFLLFRLLDTFKPYPAYSLQRIKGSAGVMMDDIVAGLYTNLILQVVWRFTSLSAS